MESGGKKPRIQLPKDALRRINLGQSFAEYDKVLLKPDVFVKTPAIEAALDHSRSKCFYIGRRGTGKTAITFFLKSKLKWAFPLHPQILLPTSIPIHPNEFNDTRQKPFRSICSCLRRALADEALSEWTNQGSLGFSNFTPRLNRERNNVEDYSFDLRLLKFFEDTFTPLREGNDKDWLKQITQSKEVTQEVDNIAIQHKLHAIFMIDRIDEAWDGSDQAILFLRGLMHTCVDISSITSSIRPLVFLRENIFERVRQLDNEFARLETCVVSLDWTKELLLQLVERRLNLPFNTRLPLGGETWDYFFESHSNVSSRELVFDYCQGRPRDILTYCSFAIESAQSHLRQKVLIEDLQEARRRFSDSRLKDLGDEYSENYPQLQLVLSRFYGLGREFTMSGIAALVQKLLLDPDVQMLCKEWIYMFTTAERFIEIMYNIGFFGIRNDDNLQFRSMGVKSTNPPRITALTIAVIHPSYSDALNLQEIIVGDLREDFVLRTEGLVVELPASLSLEGYFAKVKEVLDKLCDLPTGKDSANIFEEIVGDIVRLCFHRVLGNVEAKVRNYDGTVIRDWIASNMAHSGFWEL